MQPQRLAEYERHFPVGALLALGATTTLPGVGPTQCNNVAGLTAHMPVLIGNGLCDLVLYKAGPHWHEVLQPLMAVVESQPVPCTAYMQVMAKRTATAPGLAPEFTAITSVPNDRATADPLVATVVADLQDHPSLMGYLLDDDASQTSYPERAARNHTLVRSFQAQDSHGRPASAMWRDRGYAALGADCRLIWTFEYACGYGYDGLPKAEGDLRRATFDTITGIPNADFVDAIRHRIAMLPPDARHLWCVQAHWTNTGPLATRLRQPTDRELRLQFWLLIAEGATGLIFFPFTDFDVGGGAGIKPMLGARPSSLAVAHELSLRLSIPIRERLLGCRALGSLTTFTAVGGGTTYLPVNYPSANVGELVHDDGTVYVAVVNRSTTPTSVVISHPTRWGCLVSLETGVRYRLGVDGIPLGALDGTILQHESEWQP